MSPSFERTIAFDDVPTVRVEMPIHDVVTVRQARPRPLPIALLVIASLASFAAGFVGSQLAPLATAHAQTESELHAAPRAATVSAGRELATSSAASKRSRPVARIARPVGELELGFRGQP
jgi:hypothetical protein